MKHNFVIANCHVKQMWCAQWKLWSDFRPSGEFRWHRTHRTKLRAIDPMRYIYLFCIFGTTTHDNDRVENFLPVRGNDIYFFGRSQRLPCSIPCIAPKTKSQPFLKSIKLSWKNKTAHDKLWHEENGFQTANDRIQNTHKYCCYTTSKKGLHKNKAKYIIEFEYSDDSILGMQ